MVLVDYIGIFFYMLQYFWQNIVTENGILGNFMCLVFGENHGKLEMKKNTVIGRHFC